MAMTLTIQIGNSDGKLTEHLWHRYMAEVYELLDMETREIHFAANSHPSPQAPWQNACYVCDVQACDLNRIRDRLKEISNRFHQDAVAWTEGETIFI
jgi:hypothetical protein